MGFWPSRGLAGGRAPAATFKRAAVETEGLSAGDRPTVLAWKRRPAKSNEPLRFIFKVGRKMFEGAIIGQYVPENPWCIAWTLEPN